MKGQEDFFGKLGMAPDRDEVTTNDINLDKSTIPESGILQPVKDETLFFSEHFKTLNEEVDKKTVAEEKFLKMRNSRPDIYD